MPSVGDEIRLVSCGQLFSQETCNVFYFTVGVWTGNLAITGVLSEFLTQQNAATGAFRSSQHTLTNAIWNNLTDPVEQGNVVLGTPLAGSRAEDGLPPYAAFSFILNRSSASTRQGYKRLAGVVESQQDDGKAVLTQPVIDAAVAFLGNTFVSSQGDELDPVIIGRNPDGSLNLAVVNPVISAQLQENITTQNSRKFGRGN